MKALSRIEASAAWGQTRFVKLGSAKALLLPLLRLYCGSEIETSYAEINILNSALRGAEELFSSLKAPRRFSELKTSLKALP